MNSVHSRLSLYLLFTPFLLWLALLIIIPHIFMFLVSISVKTGVREYVTGLGNYMVFFTEPLYWNTFARTAFMSISATFLTLLIGFPVAYYIAKLTRGRTKTVQHRFHEVVVLVDVKKGDAEHRTKPRGKQGILHAPRPCRRRADVGDVDEQAIIGVWPALWGVEFRRPPVEIVDAVAGSPQRGPKSTVQVTVQCAVSMTGRADV